MKQLIIAIVLALSSVTFTTYAQGSDELQFGLKAGINLSNVYDSKGEDFDADAKVGLAAGAFLAVPIGKFVGFQPEILFSQKGFRGTGEFLGSPYEFTRTTSYIDLPLLISFKPNTTVSLLAGPQISYLVRQKDVFRQGANTSAQEQAFENENLRRNTLCFTAGGDFHLEPVVVGVRAGWDLLNNNGNGTSSTPRYKNVWMQVTFGFIL